MAVKKRTRKNPLRGRMMAAAMSLCLLAAAGMVGMYTVGRSEKNQREEELAQKVAEAEKAFEEAKKLEEELEEQKQEAASSTAKAECEEKKDTKKEPKQESVAELEGDYAGLEPTEEYFLTEEELAALEAEAEEAALQDAAALDAEAFTYNFAPETDKLLWPVAGNIILDYSMDKTVFFTTLEQYKYNPAVIIQAEVNQDVLCGANGQVTKIEENDELGTTVTVDFGNGYEGVYGQLKDVAVEPGSPVQAGVKLGLVNEPTRFYVKEGSNVYFKVLKDGKPVDPMNLLQ